MVLAFFVVNLLRIDLYDVVKEIKKVKVGKSRSLKTNVGEYPTFSLWLYVNRIRNL